MQISETNVPLKSGGLVTLRSPTPAEAQLLLEHIRIVFHESYRNMNQAADHFDSFSAEQESKIIEDFATSTEKFMISAFYQGSIIGNIGFFGMGKDFLKHSARIGMGVERKFHNQGLGTALLNQALQSGKQAGFHRVELTVRTFNEPGITLYERAGFLRVGLLKEIAFFDGSYWDEYLYQILL